MDTCLRVLKESNKSRFNSYSARNSVLIISHITFQDCRVYFFFRQPFSKQLYEAQGLDKALQGCAYAKKVVQRPGAVRKVAIPHARQLRVSELAVVLKRRASWRRLSLRRFSFTDKTNTNLYLSIRTISNIYNFKLCRIVYKLKTKYMSTIENYLQL